MRNNRAISAFHGRRGSNSTNADRSNAGHGLESSVSTNSQHPCFVRIREFGNKQSASASLQRPSQGVTGKRQRIFNVRSQSADVDCPRLRTCHRPELAVHLNRQRSVRAAASPFPLCRQQISRFTSKSFPPMTSFDPTAVRKAVEEFSPRRPQKFQDLLPAKDVITELRQKRASYRSIADLLSQHCLPTSKTAIAVFCHQVLGETVRPRKRPSRKRPPAPTSANGGETTTDAVPAAEAGQSTETPTATNDNEAPPPRTRGPRIAQVRVLKPQST